MEKGDSTLIVRIKELLASSSLAFSCLLLAGCSYPEVSPQTYELAKALYSVSNLQREDGLQRVEELIEESLAEGSISEREAGYLSEILEDCRQGEWSVAQHECRRMMEDQVD